MITVYKIITDEGVIEHVGMTARTLEHRFKEHQWENPAGIAGRGKFYGRDDVRIELISEWETRAEAKKSEMYWQQYYNVKDQQFSNRKLTDDQVKFIRENPRDETYNELATRFIVSYGTISNIKRNKFYNI